MNDRRRSSRATTPLFLIPFASLARSRGEFQKLDRERLYVANSITPVDPNRVILSVPELNGTDTPTVDARRSRARAKHDGNSLRTCPGEPLPHR